MSNLMKFKNSNETFIVKPYSRAFSLIDQNGDNYFLSTKLLNKDKIKNEYNIPSIVQKCINRKFELRVTYLDGDFYCTKMLENKIEKFEIDSRMSLFDDNLRYEVYLLSNEYKKKLKKLMIHFELNFASMDILVDKNDNLYFLEINPFGQFMNYSLGNNFNLEKKIAKVLIKNNK